MTMVEGDKSATPVGAEAGQATATTDATVSSKVAAGSSSVSESSSDSVASGNKEHGEPKGQQIDEVHLQEMFDAVIAARKAALNEDPREAWTTTVATLYAIEHSSLPIDAERVSSGKHRYPKLRGDEKSTAVLIC
uniref:Uncharacterized protein n=1 Tax=Peronospora matthiolae TaxID=2874970 RepID=A0AAV1UJF1_9STRA